MNWTSSKLRKFCAFWSFCALKDTINLSLQKDYPQNRKNHLQIVYLIRDLSQEYIKNSYNSTIKIQIIQLKNRQRTCVDISPKKIYKWPMDTWNDTQYHWCCCLVTKWYPTLLQHLKPTRLLCPWDFSGENTGVGCHFLLQGSFWPRDWQVDSLPPSHQGHPLNIINHQENTN